MLLLFLLEIFLRCMHERCRTAAISAPFTPLATFRFQPLPAVAFLGVTLISCSHHVTSQFSAFASALTGSALLGIAWRCLQILTLFGDIDTRNSRCSQISLSIAGIVRSSRRVVSNNVKPS